MRSLREAWTRTVAFFRKSALDLDLDEELAAHVDTATDDHVRRGVPEPEARRLALARLGGLEAARLRHREARGLPWLDGLLQDMRYAVRSLRRTPGFTVTAIVVLALGIGMNTAVFVLTSAFFKGFSLVDDNARIVYMRTRNTSHPGQAYGVSSPDFGDWRSQARSFASMAAGRGVARVSLVDPGRSPETYWAEQISANTFDVVGQQPILGRDFEPADERGGAQPVTILTHGLWKRRYDSSPDVVGRTIRVNGVPTVVIGIMPEGFTFPDKQDLWLPLTPTPDSPKRDARDDLMLAFGRLADGASIDSARVEMLTIGRRLAAAYPSTNEGFYPKVEHFDAFFHGSTTLVYQAMWGAVAFVLLVACANLANLTLARASDRSRELALRIALGAGRWRIARQLLIESLSLSAVGGILGWYLASWSVRAYVRTAFALYHPAASPDLYPWFDFTMDHRALGYLVVTTIGTGLLFGLAPARRLFGVDVNATLKAGGRGALGSANDGRLSRHLITGEVALVVVLLAAAGVMTRSLLKLYTADIGIETTRLLGAYVQVHCDVPFCAVPNASYPDAAAQVAFFDRLTTRLGAVSGFASVALAGRPPAGGASTARYDLPLSERTDGPPRASVSILTVSPGYFHTLGAALLSGRGFTDADDMSRPPIAIVNQRFAVQQWPGEDPRGKRLRLWDGTAPGEWRTIVGVAPDIVQDTIRQRTDPLVYLPYRQGPRGAMWVIARASVAPEGLVDTLRRELRALDPDLPAFDAQPLGLRLSDSYRYQSRSAVPDLRRLRLAPGRRRLVCRHGAGGTPPHAGNRRADGHGRDRT